MTARKSPYQQPVCVLYNLKIESHILRISAETTDPVEGGDPTGGDPSVPNPFKPRKVNQEWSDTEE